MNSQTLWTCSIAEGFAYPDVIESTSVGIFSTKTLACRALLETLLEKDLVIFDKKMYDTEDEDDVDLVECIEDNFDTVRTYDNEDDVVSSFEWIVEMCDNSYYNSTHYNGWTYSLSSFVVI